jgi:Nucleoside-diphosphate-sugar pyrophosphorylase involved in lipopolysaccharide biosynthesis/translation initiation factor 2B, gamma/epsilon subunits (eIF-2Bgamma/eIF-2Bepsilon)
LKLVLLAAGKGIRLQPLTDTRPKPVLPILGEPMICRHVRELAQRVSIEELVVVVSYMKENVQEALNTCFTGKVTLVDQGREMGTATR